MGLVEQAPGPGPEPPGLQLAPTPRWKVGTIVVMRGMEAEPNAKRMVIGHKPNGDCMTVYVAPPPWLAGREPPVHVDPPHRLCEPRAHRTPPPPAPAIALPSLDDEDEWIRRWLEGQPLPEGPSKNPCLRHPRCDDRLDTERVSRPTRGESSSPRRPQGSPRS